MSPYRQGVSRAHPIIALRAPNPGPGFEKEHFRPGQFALPRQVIREFSIPFSIREKFQVIGIQVFGSAFNEDRFDRVGFFKILKELFDLLLRVVIGVRVLDMEDHSRVGSRRSFENTVHRGEIRRNLNLKKRRGLPAGSHLNSHTRIGINTL
ncbi:MAG: hypothetical protein BWY44_00748 [Candidatus Omnitrophica bacterium ADurb.Bin292]|nr:MAG: hypothetical protein BWY44_00748 [Candidatus Omnitrophica bacterium ADurb.Bin292]